MGANRTISKSINVYLKKYPIIAITGPRQSGKTTMLKKQFSKYRYVNLENPDMREYAIRDPRAFMKEFNKYVIFDEVQRAPELFSYMQSIVDDSGMMGQFIISGSQNFHLMARITQSLAGRVAIFKLFPFDFSEMKAAGIFIDNFEKLILKGFYPAIYDRKIPSKVFYSNYIQTYIERDITELINLRDKKTFRNFLSLCAAHAGQMLNLNSLANQCGISQPTAKSWISVLESSYIIFLLHPYYKNFSKRVVKTPKLYFYDTGLLSHLLRVSEITNDNKGMLFENMMIAELVKKNEHHHELQDLWYWRDSAGHEVDMLMQDDQRLRNVEIKCTQTIYSDTYAGLKWFADLAGKEVKSNTLIYAGDELQKRTDLTIVPWAKIFDHI
jgi:predicted AAA+ superfamily ATPase